MQNDLSENTRVPILWIAISASACVAGALFLFQIKTDLAEIRREMMPRSEMREFADDLRADNYQMGLSVPRVKLQSGLSKTAISEVAGAQRE